MEMINQNETAFAEHNNSHTSITGHEKFDANGYLIIKKVINPKLLYCEPPIEKGQYNFHGTTDNFNHQSIEGQVEGSTSRYLYPAYKEPFYDIKKSIEKAIDRKLYETYYYDRFYNPSQSLAVHTDRPACEISISVHVGSNIDEPWPFWIKTPDIYDDPIKKSKIFRKGKNKKLILKPGDGVIYKGCERPHWREPLHGDPLNNSLYYHQVFFHYVLKDGLRAHYAFDKK